MIHDNTNAVSVNSKTDKSSTRIRNYRGQVTGVVKNGVYIRSLADNHFLRQPPGICISIDVLDQLRNLQVTHLQFTNRDTKTIYLASLAHFVNHGFILDRGAGVQFALPLSEFEIEAKNASGKNLPVENVSNCAQDQPHKTALQLAFGGWR